MLKMDLEYESEILWVRLDGSLNRQTAHKINNYLNPVIFKHKIKKVIINCQKLKVIDDSGINALLNTRCTVSGYKGKLYLCGVGEENISKLKSLHLLSFTNEESFLNYIRGVKGE